MYLFDTDVLSALAKKRRPEGLMARLAATPAAAQFTTAINVAEICYGLFKLEGQGGAAESRDLFEFFEKQVFPRLTILPLETEDARAYGRLKAMLERKGRPRFEPDLQVAAIEAPPDRRHGQRPQFPGHSGPARRELARVINSALAGLTRIGLHLVLFFSTIEPCGSTWPNSESSPPGAA
jgi:tRNA(fMet)-specific endonuclease VapC